MILCHIVAATENNVIGFEGKMPWHLPEDLKHFKKITSGHPVIMGRKTYESIGRPLPNRLNIIISRSPLTSDNELVHYVSSIDEAISYCKTQKNKWGETAFIVGGGEIYKQTLTIVKKVFLTRIHKVIAGDTTYPDLAQLNFKVVSKEKHDGDPSFTFFEYQR